MPRQLIPRPVGRPLQMPDPAKSVMAAPRIKPAATRNYGKGGTPLSASGVDASMRGAGIGFGGEIPGFCRGGKVK